MLLYLQEYEQAKLLSDLTGNLKIHIHCWLDLYMSGSCSAGTHPSFLDEKILIHSISVVTDTSDSNLYNSVLIKKILYTVFYSY